MAFNFTDPIADRYLSNLPDSLRIDRSLYPEGKTIRLLTGTLDFACEHDSNVVHQRTNFTNALGTLNSSVTSRTLKQCVDPIKVGEIDSYLLRIGHSNKKFHENLLSEFCYFFYQSSRDNHTSAFVHAYRALELISYSFPLMHASMSRNYYKTYDSFRSYFNGGDEGELKFLRSFTVKLFDGDRIMSATADFNIVAADVDLQRKIYTAFKRIYQADRDIQFDDALKQFTIPYRRMIDAIVTLRNRYFHFATGGYQENVSSGEVGHPDRFFAHFNVHAITWISIIYFEVLKTLCAEASA